MAPAAVKTATLHISARTFHLDKSLQWAPAVKDAFPETVGFWRIPTLLREQTNDEIYSIKDMMLLEEPHVHDVPVRWAMRDLHLRDYHLSISPILRGEMVGLARGWVRSTDLELTGGRPIVDGNRHLFKSSSVPLPRYRIGVLPHSRQSLAVKALAESERQSFLREAEAVKGIPSQWLVLIAVFRNVPIEIISRLRFVEDGRCIYYSIAPHAGLTSTRVHDMAAVRDLRNGEIHLVAHRARFRIVML